MQNTISTIATIRQRGQLTIPDKIREKVGWLKDNAVVSINTNKDGDIVITPYKTTLTDKPDWDEIWRLIRLTRSFKSKSPSKKSLSQFIIEDRERH